MQTNSQLELVNDFVRYTGQNIYLTGKAGTGKTTFLRQLKKESPKRMIVVAPTGVAAINAGGMTIHSFFQLSFAPQMGEHSEQAKQKFFNKTKINIIRSLDLLVIDEISMVRADVLDAIDRVLKRYRRNNQPFGGVQLLMIGDLQQLAPVVKREEWDIMRTVYDTVFFFSSLALKETSYVSIELTHVYRQQDRTFISILNKVRENRLDAEAAKLLNERYIPNFKVPDDSDYITLCTHNNRAKNINDVEIGRLPTSVTKLTAKIEGNFPVYAYPTDEVLDLKLGSQVMFVKNDPNPEKLYYNGKIGKITHMAFDDIRVQCPEDDFEIDVTPQKWENIKYTVDERTAEITEDIEGTFEQIPLKTAWAITIHKSQGLTFEHAVIDAQSSFAHGQVYVALSRCKTLEGMVLSSPIAPRSIISDNTVNSFVKHVEENQPDDTVLSACKNAYQAKIIHEVYDFTRIAFLLRGILRVAQENYGSFPESFIHQLDDMNMAMSQHLLRVSTSFDNQVKSLLAENPDLDSNPTLQQRIIKASEYFSEQTKNIILSHLLIFNLEIDNKTIAKQINRYIDDLQDEINMTVKLIELCKGGFNLSKVLDLRAKIAMQPKQKKATKKATPATEDIEHPELFKMLRSYRYEKAEEMQMPAYVIFSQKALLSITHYLPQDIAALKGIKGIGAMKAKQFGPDIINMVLEYCREYSIDTGSAPKIEFEEEKPKKKKVETKKQSYDLYKSGLSVKDIATERALSARTILGHLSFYVATGDVDATDFVDIDKLKLMASYFKSASDQTLKTAKDHFGDKMSYNDLSMGLSRYLSLKQKNRS